MYRSINFYREVIKQLGFAQPNTVFNFSGAETTFTRMVKNFTVLVSKTTDDVPFYPCRQPPTRTAHKVPSPDEAA